MTDPDQPETVRRLPPPPPAPPRRPPFARRAVLATVLVAACAAGAAGATVVSQRNQAAWVMLEPAPISAMKDGSAVALKGQVAEVFGNKFIMADDSGRALVETGPKGEGEGLVAPATTVTVQGRFEHGFVHAAALQFGDGHTVTLGPPGPPPPPPPRPGAP